MERASSLLTLPQIEAQVERIRPRPRPGQRDIFRYLAGGENRLSVKLPTGYGKTYTALSCYSILRSAGMVNRLLVIFPSDGQLLQFERQTPVKWPGYSIDGPRTVCDVRFFGAEAIKKHQENTCQVYAITVQALIGSRGMQNIGTLMQKGRWMVVVDEYHHYGIDRPFGDAVNSLSHEFLLCMSATPYRPKKDGAFSPPQVSVTYREAVKQKAVKPLTGHCYHYKIDAVTDEGEVVSYTTQELVDEAGGATEKKIAKLQLDRKMRWSPKYISPLVTNPIERMLSERIKTGHRLQAIIGAMCVSHAEVVCEQIRSTFPELSVDWVGTGDDGRSQEVNNKILSRFAPTDGSEHSLDILVHVGMAGEGLDTVNVSEVVHLNAAGVNNTNNQENGRASRYLEGVTGHVNFDACSGYAQMNYVGKSIMDAMDDMPASPGEEDEKNPQDPVDELWTELPDEPYIRIVDVECISIDSGDETVKKMAAWMVQNVTGFSRSDLQDDESDVWGYAIAGVRKMRTEEAEACNERARLTQWEDALKSSVQVLTGNIIRLMKSNGARIERSLPGDIKRRINTRKKRSLGPVSRDIECLSKHYEWVKNLEREIGKTREVPTWLS